MINYLTYLLGVVYWGMERKKIQWSKVNWKLIDVVLAKELGLSRERVRQKRNEIRGMIEKRDELAQLFACRKEVAGNLEMERTECIRQRVGIEYEITKELKLNGYSARYSELLALRFELRLRLREVHRKLRLFKNGDEISGVLKLCVEDLEPLYWHRPGDTLKVYSILGRLPLEKMTRSEILEHLGGLGYVRGVSWLSVVLKDMGRGCLRKVGARNVKYAWGRVVYRGGLNC